MVLSTLALTLSLAIPSAQLWPAYSITTTMDPLAPSDSDSVSITLSGVC